MKTKIIAILLCAAALFAVSSCGKTDEITPEETTGVTEQSAEGQSEVQAAGSIQTAETVQTTSGDVDLGGIVLPEDGKIYFGDKKTTKSASDNKPDKTTVKSADGTKQNTSKTPASTENATTVNRTTKAPTTKAAASVPNTTAKTPATEKQTAKPETATTQSGSAQEQTGWGKIEWN